MTMYVKAEDEEVLVFKQHEVICEPSVLMRAVGALRDRT